MLVDGIDVRDLDPDVLWGSIGLVPQRAYLFAGTVASNLPLGWRRPPDRTRPRTAPHRPQGEGFVRAMPEGLQAPIAQGGTNVSGGQRQRLAIARALVKRSPVTIFDDSFSAWTPRPTPDCGRRSRAARRRPRASSSPSASRRLLDADQIIVLEAGRIVAQGRHDELLGRSRRPTARSWRARWDRRRRRERDGTDEADGSHHPAGPRGQPSRRPLRRRRDAGGEVHELRSERQAAARPAAAAPDRRALRADHRRGERGPQRGRAEAARQRDERHLRGRHLGAAARGRHAGAGHRAAARHGRRPARRLPRR